MSKKPQTNAGDEAEVKGATQRDTLRLERERADLLALLDTPAGRRFIWRKMAECGVFSQCEELNARVYLFEGRRSIGLKMLAEIDEAKPEALLQMMQEAKSDPLA